MHKFKFSLTGLAAATATAGLALVLSTSAMAAQTVNPSSAPTGGTNFAGTTQSVPAGGSLTFYGVYSDDSATPESGLGLKVKYDATKINVVLSEEYTKCRIAPAQQQAAGATSQWVLGFIDTSIRASGAVGWPDLADTAAGGATTACLNASGNTDTAAASATGLKLFKGVVSWVGTPTVGATAAITLDAEGNFSYANASPSFANKSFTVQAAAAGSLALAATDPIVSRKTHGAAGVFEIPISAAGVITGTGAASAATVEPRQATAANPHRVVFKFTGAVTAATGGVAVAASTGTAPTATTTFSGNEMIVDLTGVTNGQRVSINATNINGVGVSAGTVVGFLVGDTNGNRTVQGSDVTFVQQRLAAPVTAANFKADINGNGSIQGSDVTAVQQRLSTTLQ
jgi:Dockerin type I domain